ncbi:host attachment protein [Novosphingobium sp. FKTRR1]|uniref:baeRF12 domain-containing protein n=1 Tax=Novosphingobium sp. FKTRR1 TaxID=2879118 RepID=UPI001CF08A1C|nr:host attachment family protein [Novosphingobium sp. FKTRR1]
MIVPNGTLILVVDGARSALFRNSGAALAPQLDLIESADAPSPGTAEQGTDHPGRAFESSGTSRSAYDSTDFHQQDEDRFARRAAAQLDRLAADGKHALILVAAPRVLGIIRPLLAPATHHRLISEIARDYTGRPAQDIAAMLVSHET